jgi:hypothetical protein
MNVHSEQETTEPDNINIGLVATVTVVGALLVLAIALSLTALVRSESASRGSEAGVNADLGTVRRLKAEQRAKLEASPAWLDRAKGQVAVPIDRAMEMVTAEIRKDPNLATGISAAPAIPASAGSASPAPALAPVPTATSGSTSVPASTAAPPPL